jgi:FkbM family methyltransferase
MSADTTDSFPRTLIDAAAQLDLTMIDLGARGGLDSDLLPLAAGIRAIGFEPEPAEADDLLQASQGSWRAVEMFRYAVGGKKGRAKLHLPASTVGASLLPHNEALLDEFGYEQLHKPVRTIDVDVTTLDDLLREGAINKASYIKIDIEGAELDVLRASTRILETCLAIKVEVSFLEQRRGQPLAHHVTAFLDALGFDLIDIRDVHRWRRRPLPAHPLITRFCVPYSRGRIAQADLLFFRRHPEGELAQSVAAAMLIAAAMGYFDFAMTLLRSHRSCREWWTARGVDVEAELGIAAYRYGRLQIRKAMREHFRRLVPLLRSIAGRLPYVEPSRPY